MNTMAIAAIVVMVALAALLAGAAFWDRRRAKRIEHDLASKPSAPRRDCGQAGS
ncbi:MAG: hypothetical protein QM638_04305 [Nocardioides sp.]|uniref:hypothetical protein n=1 Tax=Nocardioides sp. TaxID=35761 RepID=UPI0039E60CB2